MRASECGQVITACGWFDNRKTTEEAMLAWSKAIQPWVAVTEAIDAVAVHYGATDEWCKPSHINVIVRAVQLRRLTDAGTPPVPGDFADDRDRELGWIRTWQDHVKHGADSGSAAVAADLTHGVTRAPIAVCASRVKAIEEFATNRVRQPLAATKGART